MVVDGQCSCSVWKKMMSMTLVGFVVQVVLLSMLVVAVKGSLGLQTSLAVSLGSCDARAEPRCT